MAIAAAIAALWPRKWPTLQPGTKSMRAKAAQQSLCGVRTTAQFEGGAVPTF